MTILRSINGELLRQSDAIIDLRSTFGVTKNVSNEVSQVKLYNNPSQVFRDANSNCVENGDGLDFTGNIDGYLKGLPVGFPNEFFIAFWAKKPIGTPSEQAVYSLDSSGTRGWRVYFNGDGLAIYDGTVNIKSTTGFYNPSNIWTYFTLERNKAGLFQFTVDGLTIVNPSTWAFELVVNDNFATIGNAAFVSTTRAYKGNIDDFILAYNSPYKSWNFNGGIQVFTPPKRSSE